MKETWRDIPGYEGLYQVSDMGRVRSLGKRVRTWSGGVYTKDGRVLKQVTKEDKYLVVTLHKDRGQRTYYVHQLVALAFLGDSNGLEVNHRDLDKANNRLENLEYVSHGENIRHAIRNNAFGTGSIGASGISHHQAKLTDEDVIEIRQLYAGGEFLQRELAAMFGISKPQVSDIVNRKYWKHLL